MTEDDNPFTINEKEVMEYYGYSGRSGSLNLKQNFCEVGFYILLHTQHPVQDLL